MNNTIDSESRNYSFSDIEDDPRLLRTTKEFFVTMGIYIVYGALMILNLFTLGRHTTDFPRVLGFPLWIFVLICLLVLMITTVELVCTFFYKDMDLNSNSADGTGNSSDSSREEK